MNKRARYLRLQRKKAFRKARWRKRDDRVFWGLMRLAQRITGRTPAEMADMYPRDDVQPDRLIREEGVQDGKCIGCGCDLQENPPRFVFHGDGNETYCYGFECVKCEGSIVQYFKRSRPWFMDEMEPMDDGGILEFESEEIDDGCDDQ